ncbi:MAG: hypothetical protein FWC33_01115, partial [Candidatus Bathyarchaeota archaeon]|nr:hypothetical protein [Candidatus Termiticorpusculum sp.]
IAEVGLNISNSQMSANLPNSWNWPAGASIANFRGTAGLNNEVRSIRGRSGVHQSRVTALNATVGTRTNQLLTYPNGNSLAGDSGSALIRVSDSAVLGTRSGTAIISGRTYGRYTHVQRY